MAEQIKNERIDAAGAYLAMGYQPVPVPLGHKGPRLKGWQTLRSTPIDLPGLFAGPGNIGLLLGEPSGWLIDVDLDCEEAVRLAAQHLPPTAAVTGRISRPGSHWWYRCRGVKPMKLSDPVTHDTILEIRSSGQQTLVGPSVHPGDGERYDDLAGEPAEVDPGVLEAAARALCHAVVESRGHEPTPRPSDGPDRARRPAGSGSLIPVDDVPAEVRVERCRAYLTKCPDAVCHAGGDRATFRAACECFRFGLSRSNARSVMDWFNDTKTAGERWTETEIEHKLERSEATVRSGGEFGVRLSAGNRFDGMTLEEIARQQTDVGNAARLVLRHGHRLRYSYQRGAWMVWDGRRWALDQAGESVNACVDTTLSIFAEARATESDGLLKWAQASQKRERVMAMAVLAQPRLAVVSDDLDADPWLLNCSNGTLDLRTGTLRLHDPHDLITRLAPVAYDPDAACPRFESFLQRVFDGSDELIGFVQRWHGYCLTADIRHQHLPIYHGAGGNGKSVLLDTIAAAMGDYAAQAPPELLTSQKHAQHPTEIADLIGRRMVVASETEAGAELRIQTLKRLTGDARLKGRFMREDFVEFPRTHKMVLVTNNRPAIIEDSEAVWRRVLLVPFNVVIPPEERDPALLEKLRDELPGILAWMVRGCPQPDAQSLDIPESVRLATDSYRGRSNSLDIFLKECCELRGDAVTPSDLLIAAYEAWADDHGHVPLRARAIGSVLRLRGCEPVKQRGVRCWSGIDLREAVGQIGRNLAESPVDSLMQ